jgi:hypothetical protein
MLLKESSYQFRYMDAIPSVPAYCYNYPLEQMLTFRLGSHEAQEVM